MKVASQLYNPTDENPMQLVCDSRTTNSWQPCFAHTTLRSNMTTQHTGPYTVAKEVNFAVIILCHFCING